MDLIKAMHSEYSRSKSLFYKFYFPLSVLLFGLTLLVSFDVLPRLTKASPFIVLVMQVIIFCLKRRSEFHQNSGEEVRRAAMLHDGMGLPVSNVMLARLRQRLGNLDNTETAHIHPYYASQKEVGPKRLAEITAESAFFTAANASSMSSIVTIVSSLFVGAAALSLSAMAMYSAPEKALGLAARLFVISMAFWTANDFVNLAFSFKTLAKKCERLWEECDRASGSDDSGEVLTLFTEYNCAVVKAPPIPDCVYRRSQSRLNEAWRLRYEKVA